MYQAEMWHKDERYHAPMFIHEESGEHIYAGDLVSLKELEVEAVMKVTRFFTVHQVQT